MFDSGVFDYVDVLGKAADASWTRNEIISNNMSNVNTPGYKRQDIDFESRLRQALGSMRYESVDTKVARAASSNLKGRVYTDSANFSYRLDGNNVDIHTENVELASEQIRYQALTDSISQEFSRMRTAIGN